MGDIDDASYFFFHGARWDERDKLFPLLQNIIDASYMFQYSPAKELDVTALNTSKVKNMSNMFANVSQCTNFNLGDFDTSDVINMYSMFYFCSQVNKLDVSSFDTTKVTNMSYMFSSCPKLTEIKFGDKFNTSNVTNMERLFYQGSLIDNIPALYADKCENIRTVMSYCSVLKNFGGFVNLGKAYSQKTANAGIYGLTLSDSNLLTHDSLMNVINGLYDLNLSYNVSGGGILYPQALKLGSTNLAKLTEEEIAIATNKGWNVT